MTKPKEKALVICPGRGVYNASELGYLVRYHADKTNMIEYFDLQRKALKQTPIAELDAAARYSISQYSRGDNASGLIYACSYADFLSIDRDAFDIVAVTGNSMGWYTALACGGAVSGENGFKIVNTMGTIMQQQLIGGQLVYPIVDEDWRENKLVREKILKLVETTNGLYVSIYLGGMIVLAGTTEALKKAELELDPIQDRFPLRLSNHAAFHSPLLEPNSIAGKQELPIDLIKQPSIPIIDGRGEIWMPSACNLTQLWDYTLGEQVTQTYNFTRAVETGLKEFAPDRIIVLGPGNTLGGAVAQAMIGCGWHELQAKSDFIEQQLSSPRLLAMGHQDQRGFVTQNH